VTYIVMELIHGSTLDAVLPAEGTLSTQQALGILGEAAAALDFAHRHGVVHCDVKPSNIMLQAGGAAKLTDFGIARRVTGSSGTLTGIMGTPRFMAPEQLRSQEATMRSDQYSLAVVAWILLTGSNLFDDTELMPLISKVLFEEPTARSVLSPAADRVLRHALAKDPAQRFESCGAFVAALRDAFSQSPMTSVTASRSKKRWILAGGAVAAFALAAAGGAWWFHQARVSQPNAIASAPAANTQPKTGQPEVGLRVSRAPAAPPEKSQAKPATKAAPAHPTCQSQKFDLKLYGDELSGVLTWAGPLTAGGRVSIETRTASMGRVQGDVLPAGVPVRLTVSPAWIKPETAPAAANCWAPKMVLHNTGAETSEIGIRWEVFQP